MPSEAIEWIQDAIYERESERMGTEDWVVYTPHEMMGDVHEVLSNRSPMDVYNQGTTIAGHRIEPDGLVDEPILLPGKIQDLDPSIGVIENPPESLIRQALQAYGIEEYTDETRNATTFKSRLFFEVEDRHTKLNHAKINKYNLDVNEYESHTQPAEYERVTLGQQFTDEFQLHRPDFDRSFVERQFAEGVDRQIHSVSREPVYGTRTRRIKMPYSVLDMAVRERMRCGTTYTHWGGVFLCPVDVSAHKLDLSRPNYA